MRIISITPANNEAKALPAVLRALQSANVDGHSIDEMIVVDNSSTDNTAEVARDLGARVVSEPKLGYGAACLRGLDASGDADIVIFVDGDGSDYPEEWPLLVSPIINNEADFVIGVRAAKNAERGALSPHQRFGNWLALSLIRILYGKRFTDLGPFRAIRLSKLKELRMRDKDFGWTIEMQIKALAAKLRILEIPVRYRRRKSGTSKVSGSLKGSILAGKKIFSIIFSEAIYGGVRDASR